jgi:hypothetical protein
MHSLYLITHCKLSSAKDLIYKEIEVPVRAEGNKIVEVASGKVVGTSSSAEKAKAAARVRNAIHLSNWRTRKGPKKPRYEGGDHS